MISHPNSTSRPLPIERKAVSARSEFHFKRNFLFIHKQFSNTILHAFHPSLPKLLDVMRVR